MSLIFNEIIEINCFGLSKNTKRNIMGREVNENSRSLSIDDIQENSENNNIVIQMETYADNNNNYSIKFENNKE